MVWATGWCWGQAGGESERWWWSDQVPANCSPSGVSLLLILTAGQTAGLTHFPPLSPQYSQDSQGRQETSADPVTVPHCWSWWRMLAGGWCWPDWLGWRTEDTRLVVVVVVVWQDWLTVLQHCCCCPCFSPVLTINYQPTCQLQPKSENINSQVNMKIFGNFFYHWLIPVKYSNMRHTVS